MQVSLRMSEQDKNMLDKMCEHTSRKQSDMIRLLIRQAYTRMFTPTPEHRMTDDAARYAAELR